MQLKTSCTTNRFSYTINISMHNETTTPKDAVEARIITTTMKLPRPLWERAKIASMRADESMNAFVVEALVARLTRAEQEQNEE